MVFNNIPEMIKKNCSVPRTYYIDEEIPKNIDVGLDRYGFSNVTVKKTTTEQNLAQNSKQFNIIELRELGHAIDYCQKYPYKTLDR